MSRWECKCPDKDGIWLWRLWRSSGGFGMGMIYVLSDEIMEMTVVPPIRAANVSTWWKVCAAARVETFYVAGA